MNSGIFSRKQKVLRLSITASIIFGAVSLAQTGTDESEKSSSLLNTPLQQKMFILHESDPQEAASLLSLLLKNQVDRLAYPENEKITFVPIPGQNWIVAKAPAKTMKLIEHYLSMIDGGYEPNKMKDISLSEIEDRNQVVEKLFHLKHISPSETVPKIEGLLSNNGYLRVEENAGAILVIDRVLDLLEMEKTIKEIDDPDIHANDPMVNVNLSQLDINDIIRILTQWTGKSVIPSKEAMNLTLTVFSPSKMRRDKAINLLYTVMRTNGFIAEETDKMIYIKSAPQKICGAAPLLGPDEPLETIQDETLLVRKVFKLNYYNPSAMEQIILPFLDSYGYLMADESTKSLIVMDSVKTLILIEQLIKIIDTPGKRNPDNSPAKIQSSAELLPGK